MRKLLLTTGLLLLAVAGAACSGTTAREPQTVDEARATEIAQDALAAFNDGDYTRWSHDWSAAMKSAIPEAAFQAWRTSAMDQLGAYVSLGMPARSSRQPGTYRWSFPVTFERGSATIGFAFVDGRSEVEGVFVE